MDDFIDIHGIFASLVFASHTQETRCTRIYIDTVMTNDEIEGCIFSFIPFFPSRVSLRTSIRTWPFSLLNISVSQHSFSLSLSSPSYLGVSIWTPFSSHRDIWIERRFFREEMGGCQDTCSTGRSGSSFIFMSNGCEICFVSSLQDDGWRWVLEPYEIANESVLS